MLSPFFGTEVVWNQLNCWLNSVEAAWYDYVKVITASTLTDQFYLLIISIWCIYIMITNSGLYYPNVAFANMIKRYVRLDQMAFDFDGMKLICRSSYTILVINRSF